mgnify:CR=1 FL=1|jgi:PTS system cellobiose-specific IIB component
MKKILLLCSAGMSTSMVVKKMREAAQAKGIAAEIEAVGLELFQDNLNKYDIFLLGPQVRFKKDDFQKLASTVGKKVEVINQMDYGMLKGEKIFDWALTLI